MAVTRQAFPATARSLFPAPRAARHLVPRRLFRPTPEMLAGVAALALASVNLFGPLGVLLFFASAAAVFSLRPLYNARQLLRFSPLLLLPVLAVLSTIWSDAPQRSMRVGLELFLTCAAVIAVCRSLPPERLVLVLFAAFLVMTAMIIPYVPASLSTGLPLGGWQGSKNTAGLTAYSLLAFALGVACDRQQPGLARWAAVASLPLALVIIPLTQSGGTTSSVVLTLVVFPPLALLTALRPPLRVAIAVLTVCATAASLLFVDDIVTAVADFRQNVLGKDATLTGRTYLWDFADRLSASRPWLGYGYNAFWRQGNIDAEGLWRWAGIASRSGFNFHNAFIGIRVDLGLVGMGVLILTCIGVGIAGLLRQIARPSVAVACLLGVTAVNYFRALFEEGLVAPFSLITLVWFACALYAFPGGAEGADERPRPRPRGFAPAGPRLRPESRGIEGRPEPDVRRRRSV